ncbi:MAG TPA: AMP-binding protein, partial [Candidatus Limnocylindria bacterium]|nr:AMP-binding protein [Candidatus Limnocylindria bacterium]
MGELRLPELGDRYNAAETYVDAHRAERPDKIAIRCQGRSVTYGEMARNVDRCGNALRGLGVDIEDRVAILCVDSPAFVYAFFGAIKLGAVPVPTNTLLTPRDLAYILRDSRAVAIVVSAPLLPKVLEAQKHCPRLRHVLVTTSGTDAVDGALP